MRILSLIPVGWVVLVSGCSSEPATDPEIPDMDMNWPGDMFVPPTPDIGQDLESDQDDLADLDELILEKRKVNARVAGLRELANGYFIAPHRSYAPPEYNEFVYNLAIFRQGEDWLERVAIGPQSAQLAALPFEDGAIIVREETETSTRHVEYYDLTNGEFDLIAELPDANQFGRIDSILPYDVGPVLVTEFEFVILRRRLLGLEATNRIDRRSIIEERYPNTTGSSSADRQVIRDSMIYRLYSTAGRSRLVSWDLSSPENVWVGESEWVDGSFSRMVLSDVNFAFASNAPYVHVFNLMPTPSLAATWDLSEFAPGDTHTFYLSVLGDWLILGNRETFSGETEYRVYDANSAEPVCLGVLTNLELKETSWPTTLGNRIFFQFSEQLEPPFWDVKGYTKDQLQLGECE